MQMKVKPQRKGMIVRFFLPGIALAWPIASVMCLSTDIARLSDHRVGGWPKKMDEPSTLRWLLQTPLKRLGLLGEQPECHWNRGQRRSNVIVGATLQHKETGTTFCVANYHMPCLFYVPQTMTLHVELAVRYVQEMAKKASMRKFGPAGEQGDKNDRIPYVLAGDFNFKPLDGVYSYLTTGNLDPNDQFFPTPPLHDPSFTWTPEILEPVKSAYASFDGKEPDFTNYARIREDEPFIDTLDYIFVSPSNIDVTGVQPLIHRDHSQGPFPNLESNVKEASDHVLIAADLEITSL